MSKQQLVAKQEKRTSYPKRKEEGLKVVQDLASKYDTIIVSKLFKVRAGQLMLLRKNFRSELVMVVAKNETRAACPKECQCKELRPVCLKTRWTERPDLY